MRVFVDDTIQLILNTEKDVSAFTRFRIKYEKPDGSNGQWNAALYPTDNNCVYADVQFPTSGIWRVQAYVYKSGEWYHGFHTDVKVYKRLNIPTCTTPPTTAIPTTAAPTTVAPTTVAPTTLAPTT